MYYHPGIIIKTGLIEPIAHGHVGHPWLIGLYSCGIPAFKSSSGSAIGGQKFDDTQFVERFILAGERLVIKMGYHPGAGIAFKAGAAFSAAERLGAVAIGVNKIRIIVIDHI